MLRHGIVNGVTAALPEMTDDEINSCIQEIHGLESMLDDIVPSEEELQCTQLGDLFGKMGLEGMSRDDYTLIEAVAPGTLASVNPARLTTACSMNNVEIALEGIDWKKVGIISIIVAAVLGIIAKIIDFVAKLLGKSKSVDKLEKIETKSDKVLDSKKLRMTSEAFNRKNPFPRDSREYLGYVAWLEHYTDRHSLDDSPYIEYLVVAVLLRLHQYGPKGFNLEVVRYNIEFLQKSYMSAKKFTNDFDDEKAMKLMIGNVLAGNEYSPLELHMVGKRPQENIFSPESLDRVLMQYNALIHMGQQLAIFVQRIDYFIAHGFGYMPASGDPEVYRTDEFHENLMRQISLTATGDRRGQDYHTVMSRMQDSIAAHWETIIGAKEYGKRYRDWLSGGRSEYQRIFNIGNASYKHTHKGSARGKNSFNDYLVDEHADITDTYQGRPKTMSVNTDLVTNIMGYFKRLQMDSKRPALETGFVFDWQPYAIEGKVKEDELKAMILRNVDFEQINGLMGRSGVSEELVTMSKAITSVSKKLKSKDMKKSLESVKEDLEQAQNHWDFLKEVLGPDYARFIQRPAKWESNEFTSLVMDERNDGDKISIEGMFKESISEFRTVITLVGHFTSAFDGMEKVATNLLAKRARALKAWDAFSKTPTFENIGKRED